MTVSGKYIAQVTLAEVAGVHSPKYNKEWERAANVILPSDMMASGTNCHAAGKHHTVECELGFSF